NFPPAGTLSICRGLAPDSLLSITTPVLDSVYGISVLLNKYSAFWSPQSLTMSLEALCFTISPVSSLILSASSFERAFPNKFADSPDFEGPCRTSLVTFGPMFQGNTSTNDRIFPFNDEPGI